jgi:hypothetical protein
MLTYTVYVHAGDELPLAQLAGVKPRSKGKRTAAAKFAAEKRAAEEQQDKETVAAFVTGVLDRVIQRDAAETAAAQRAAADSAPAESEGAAAVSDLVAAAIAAVAAEAAARERGEAEEAVHATEKLAGKCTTCLEHNQSVDLGISYKHICVHCVCR